MEFTILNKLSIKQDLEMVHMLKLLNRNCYALMSTKKVDSTCDQIQSLTRVMKTFLTQFFKKIEM